MHPALGRNLRIRERCVDLFGTAPGDLVLDIFTREQGIFRSKPGQAVAIPLKHPSPANMPRRTNGECNSSVCSLYRTALGAASSLRAIHFLQGLGIGNCIVLAAAHIEGAFVTNGRLGEETGRDQWLVFVCRFNEHQSCA